jgi:hypothetical protein
MMPPVLRERRRAIAAIDIGSHEAGGELRLWVRRFPRDPAIAGLRERFGDRRLRRDDIFRLGRDSLEAGAGEARRAVLAATFVWGYRPNGRAYGNYARTLASADLDGHLDRAMLAVRDGQLQAAHRALDRNIPAYGESFFTKYLYFVGRPAGGEDAPMPLILDRRVRMSLECFERFFGFEWRWSGPSSARYEYYRVALDVWADALGCFPDQIESFLYAGVPDG